VAIGTLTRRHGVRARQRETRAVVVERRVQPGTRVVTLLAGLREIRRHMIRVGRALEILQVARDTSRAVEVVVVVDVAVDARTRRNRVHARQRKSGRRVIELAGGPGDCVMALLASCWESGVRHRRRCVRVIVLVATHASRAGDVVVIVDVAVRALARRHHVRSGQREAGLRVIKACRLPCARVVTHLAGLRETAGHMVRIAGALKIFQVT